MKKRGLHWTVALLVLAAAFGFAACSAENGPVIAVPESGADWPVTITDSSGAKITIEKEPETVISIAPNITEIIYALGAEDKLIARTDYCDYPAEALGIESIGSIMTPDIERILELNPDLVIASTLFDEAAAMRLRELGVVILLISETRDIEGSYSMIETVGLALNRKTEADSLVADMKSTVNTVTSRVAGLERPSVYYVVGFGEDGDFTAGGDTFIGQLLEMAGGDSITKNIKGWSYNLESLLEADPDIIILPAQNNWKASFESAEGYKDLTAVKEGRVYEIDNNMLDRQGARNAEGLKAMAEILHPLE